MATAYTKLLFEISQIRNELKNTLRMGTVHEIKGDKMRIFWGNDKNGKPQYSPYIHNSTGRGEATRRFAYSDEKGEGGGQDGSSGGGGSGGGAGGAGGGSGGGGGGSGGQGQQNGGQQNITLLCPGGDYRQAVVLPYGPQAKGSHKPPKHANKSGKGEEPWQMKDNRYNRTHDSYDWWFEKDEDEKGGGGGGGQQGGEDKYNGGDKGDQRMFHNKEKGVGGQHKEGKAQYIANKDGPGMMQDKQFLTISKKDKQIMAFSEEDPIINKPWVIKKKENPHKMYTSEGAGAKKKSGGGQSGGGSKTA